MENFPWGKLESTTNWINHWIQRMIQNFLLKGVTTPTGRDWPPLPPRNDRRFGPWGAGTPWLQFLVLWRKMEARVLPSSSLSLVISLLNWLSSQRWPCWVHPIGVSNLEGEEPLPPSRPNFFHFHAIFGKNLWVFGPNSRVDAPFGRSWIHHCIMMPLTLFTMKNAFFWFRTLYWDSFYSSYNSN